MITYVRDADADGWGVRCRYCRGLVSVRIRLRICGVKKKRLRRCVACGAEQNRMSEADVIRLLEESPPFELTKHRAQWVTMTLGKRGMTWRATVIGHAVK